VITDAVDHRTRELRVVALPGILVLAGGFYPESVLEPTRTASEDWGRTLTAV